MLTRIRIRNFKLFEEVDLDLGQRVLFVGQNNSGKTSALQALALWHAGIQRWVEKRGTGRVPEARAGVTLNRRDLIAVPVPTAKLLWRDLHVREGHRQGAKAQTRNILIEIEVEGIGPDANPWRAALEFDYANEESIYCRVPVGPEGRRLPVPQAAAQLKLAYLQPMSGLAASEVRLDEGALQVRLGEGRTAEVLRNLCWLVHERNEKLWDEVVASMQRLFSIRLDPPRYIPQRGEITMTYRTPSGVRLDLSSSGRGQQQVLLLLAFMAAYRGSILLLDEPDAHLEILRQRQIYDVLSIAAEQTGSQILAASHSEVLLNEAAGRDVVVAFVGRPHRIDKRASQQVLKALKEIPFEDYLQAEQTGWVLYLEGSTDLKILKALAHRLGHPAAEYLERVFVHYVGNQPARARDHFHGLREAKPDLVGLAIFDRLETIPSEDPYLTQTTWRRREIESYLCQEETLLAFAEAQGRTIQGDLFGKAWRQTMDETIAEIADALARLGRPNPWGPDLRVSEEFLKPVFRKFYQKLGLVQLADKSDFHQLAGFVPPERMDPEVREKLDLICETARRARPLDGAPQAEAGR